MASYHRASRQSFVHPAAVQQTQMQLPQIQAAQAQLQQAHAQMQQAMQQAQTQAQHTQGQQHPLQQGTMGSYQSNLMYEARPPWGPLSTNNILGPPMDVGTFDRWPLSPTLHMPLSAGGASNPAGVFSMPTTHRLPTPPLEHKKEEQLGPLTSNGSDKSDGATVDPKVLLPPKKPAASLGSSERSPSTPNEASRGYRREDKTELENEEEMTDVDNLSTATTAACSCGQAANSITGSGVAAKPGLVAKLNGIESILLELRDYNTRNQDTVPLMTAMNRSLNLFIKEQSELRVRLVVVEDRSLDSLQELTRIDASYETLANNYVRFRDKFEGRDAKSTKKG